MGYRAIGRQWLGGSALLCLALGACNKSPQAAQQPATGAPIAALQLATAPPPPPTYAPPASALPPPPRPVVYRPSREHWRYLTDAYDMSDAFADTPPDYTVPYEGEDPYVWRADDGAYRVVEWLPGGARYYYYEPGADEPFLIQDPEYSYAYDNGALAGVYTLAGALVADRIAAEREGYAARYYARGRDLYRAAVNERRRAAYAAQWQQRAPIIQTQRTRWQRGREEEPGWRDWYQAHQPQQEARWAPERQHRAAYAAALGAAGIAGAGYAMHHRGQPPAPQVAGARPVPQPLAGMNNRPGPFPNARDQRAEQAQRQAAQTQQRQLQQAQQTQRLEAQRQAQVQQAQRRQLEQTQQDQRAEAQRRAQAQHAEVQARAQQAQQAQRGQLQQAQQAQYAEAQRQTQAQHAEAQARAQQTQQAQRRQLQQAQQAQRAEAQRQAQAQRAEAQAREQQAQQAQRRALQQAQQAQRAEVQRQTQAQRAQAPRPSPAQHAQATRPPAAQPASQPRGGGQKDDRHHH